MQFEILGWSPDGPTLELDWRRFRYAGKFVMSNTGKAVALADGEVVGALAFNADRTDENRAWIRYVTVRDDRRGEGIGPRLTAFAADRLLDRYERLRTGANNSFSYHSFYKAGFAYTGETTGIAELVLERPGDRSGERYRAGLHRYDERDLDERERQFVAAHRNDDPPAVIDAPNGDN
ncbi:GNAT family N-acetyltransferase [Halanaeroarchaeum sulfurireducens]|uniref:N-acetyltransferase GCN5 n=1 Tax=Halanaeroarchaeum sulfurireducens TaxID=1604004 RepID=A0A0F7PD49_9EURY|nr:GNAT family N-acetyltransferase [Halanaeroarchaeum sulfurireducens]AKH97574.1 N-acetyltransferase GCN5 [Halanaeroarchaeum sulfurireducens]ALG81970.1 N-acetyltransferase GCN5 [Halanaeroarchaeum sulfurireducens]